MDGVRFIALKVKIHKFWLGELYFRGPRLEGGRAVQGSGMGGGPYHPWPGRHAP